VPPVDGFDDTAYVQQISQPRSDPHRRSRDETALGAATVIGVQLVDGPGSTPSIVSTPHPHLAPPGGLHRVRTEAGAAEVMGLMAGWLNGMKIGRFHGISWDFIKN